MRILIELDIPDNLTDYSNSLVVDTLQKSLPDLIRKQVFKDHVLTINPVIVRVCQTVEFEDLIKPLAI